MPTLSKRPASAISSFFQPVPKKLKYELPPEKSEHPTYPLSIPHLPVSIEECLNTAPATSGKPIKNQPDLDLCYFQPFIPKEIQDSLFKFLRNELFYYRVEYKINRFGTESMVKTPRYTTVFGVDETSFFAEDGKLRESQTKIAIPGNKYKCKPRPIPQCLDVLKNITENATGESFNFCLVNYYADGSDSIAYHSDDERFLGPNPAIASFSFGAARDFLMKHKPVAPSATQPNQPDPKPIKFTLGAGEMILMQGPTQKNWLHSVPKRSGKGSAQGRINITFRKALVKGGTENYYQYNVGDGHVFRWDEKRNEMVEWTGEQAFEGTMK